MPASASPSDTFVTTALTLSSSDTGRTLTCRASSACRAYLPAGTSGAASTTLRSGRARSARPLTPLGLPLATTICRRLPANTCGPSTRSLTLPMVLESADANTSAGAPCRIWVASAWLPAKLRVTRTPGWERVKSASSLANAPLSDDAASTLISVPPPAPEPPPPPHAASSRASSRLRAPVAYPRCMRTPPSGRGRQLHDHAGGLDRRHRQHPRGQVQLVGRLPGHQRDQPVGSGAELDLGGDGVLDHPRDNAGEAVAGRLGGDRLGLWRRRRLGEEAGQLGPVDHPLPPAGAPRGQPSRVRQPADRVRADPQQLGRLPDPIACHGKRRYQKNLRMRA